MASRLIELSDERLARLVNRGDEAAFEALYDRHHAALLAFCRHMAGNREDGEDALQQTFVRAHRALRERRPPDAVRPWLFAIARNRCRTLISARGVATVAVEDVEPSYDGLADDVARRADLRQLVADLSRLPDDQRGALVLFELGGLEQAEIATVLGCPPGKVKALVYQARSELIAERDARSTPCDTIRLELSVATGGALRRGPLRRHLRACDGCSEYREIVAAQRAGLASVIPVPPPLALKATILAGLLGGGAASHGAGAAGAGAAGAAGGHGAAGASSGVAAGAASTAAAGATGGAGVATTGLVVAAKLAVGAAIAAAAVTGGAGAIGHGHPDGPVLARARQAVVTPAPTRVARKRATTAAPHAATVAAPDAGARPAAVPVPATATATPVPTSSPSATPKATPTATPETARAVVRRRVAGPRHPARRRVVTGGGVAILGVITPTPPRKRPTPAATPAPGASATPTPTPTPVRRPRVRPRPAAPVTPRPRPAVSATPVPSVAPPALHPRPRVRPAPTPTPTPEPAPTATATATPEATPTPTPTP